MAGPLFKGQPESKPLRCRSCGSESFRAWYDVPQSQGIENLWVDEFWCANCDDHADTIEELVGLKPPAEPKVEPPVVVVTRHPDFADDIREFGDCPKTIYLDFGGSFDITKVGPEDEDEIKSLIESTLDDLKDLPSDHPAVNHVCGELEQLWEMLCDVKRTEKAWDAYIEARKKAKP